MRITLQNLSKALGGRNIFTDFSLDLDDGVRLCVCGANGTGKSTLLRILAGQEAPDAGKVILPRGCRLGYVEQELDAATLERGLLEWVQDVLPDWNEFWRDWERAATAHDSAAMLRLTERQHELEARYGYNPEQRARAVLTGLGFTERRLTRRLGQLSGGWRERAKLARVLTAGADILLLDEPTNHLDIEAVEWLEAFLPEFRGVLVFVAHDRIFMDKTGTHILYLGASRPVFRKGSFTRFLAMQEEIEAQRDRENKRLNEEIQRKMAFVERFRAKATKARQAASRQKMAKKLEKELENFQPEQRRKELHFQWPQPARAEKLILGVADMAYRFPDGGGKWPPLSFTLYRGQRIALVGRNGCGKSVLLHVIAGLREKSGGSLRMGSLVRLGYFSQHQMETLRGQGTVLGEIRRLSDPRTNEEELMSVLGLFLLGQSYFERKVDTLSGGEKSRLMLAGLFLARCNFLVLDEPTNHLDLESREALITALDAFEGTVLMVAHDRWLISTVAEQVWLLNEHGITVYEEGFEQYDEARRAARQAGENPRQAALSARDGQRRARREEAARRNELSRKTRPMQEEYVRLEQELEALFTEQHDVEGKLADPDIYADASRANDLLRRFAGMKEQGERIVARMSALEAELARVSAGEPA
ncbi:MAG: ABC-F family ATP-binding cassette domain-containing protein [Deltaproteobacteria bacterium]|jgi:ATP-binding cassette subfamily F protein 3|nr:ABC-F family ATP-binding cassette domain-containing protein [Deltaproteobacteria bacterium]